MLKFLKTTALALMLAALFSACSSDDSGGSTQDTKPSVSLSSSSLELNNLIPLKTLEGTITAIKKNSDAVINWTSSDSNIISITNKTSDSPKLTVYQEGSVTLTASFTEKGQTYSADCRVNVSFAQASKDSPSFSVTDLEEHSANVKWTKADSVTYDRFLLLLYKGETFISKEELASTEVSKVLTELSSETEYTVTLYGIFSDKSGYTKNTSTFSTTADLKAPDSVILNETKINENASEDAITLYWTNPSDTDLKKIVISISSTEDESTFEDIELSSSNYLSANASLNKKITGLKSSLQGTSYSFTVKTFDTNNNHDQANDVTKTFKTKADPAPSSVTFKNADCILEEDSITVKWTNPADTDIAKVELSISSTEDTTTDFASLAASLTSSSFTQANANCSYKFSNLLTDGSDGVSYTIKIILTDKRGNSNEGNSITLSTAKDETAPAEVSGVKVKTRASSITVSWTNPSDKDFDSVIVSLYDSNSSQVGSSVTVTADNEAKANFTDLTEESTYSLKIQTADIYDNKSTGFTKTGILAKNPQVESVYVERGFTGQIVVSWNDIEEEGLSYVVKASSTDANAAIPQELTVAEGKQKIAVSGLTTAKAYTFTVAVKEGEATYNATSSNSISPAVIVWQLKSGYEERMIHPAVLADNYSKDFVKASSYHIVASDHNDQEAGPDFSRSSSKYNYWIVVPGLKDPSNPEYFSLIADSVNKYSDANSEGKTNIKPQASSYYAYFDTNGNHEAIQAGTVNSAWKGRALSAYNEETNRLWIGPASEIEDNDEATFYIADKNAYNKNPTGTNDVPAYQPYAFFKSTGGLYWQHAWCIFRGNERADNDVQCSAITRQVIIYEGEFSLTE